MLFGILGILIVTTLTVKDPLVFGEGVQAQKQSQHNDPNFLVIVADDLGFSDIGQFGSEIPTPNIDALAKDGKVLSNFHVLPACSPTRSELLTGIDNHLNGLGAMAEAITPNQLGKPGYQTYLNDKVITVADILRDAGYHTIMSGKWHLSNLSKANPVSIKYKGEPSTRGFEESFTLLGGHADHFNSSPSCAECNAPTFLRNGREAERLEGVYSSDLFTDEMIKFISKAKVDDRPLLMYLAFQVTHEPYQSPKQITGKYDNKYDQGWEFIREQRLERQKMIGIWPADMQFPEEFPPHKEWSIVSPERKEDWSKNMSTRAAMIDNMDANVGKIIYYLKEIGEYDNTFIVFTSDNGGSDAWSGTSSVEVSPLSGFKNTMYEGGIRSPLIVKEPLIFDSNNNDSTPRHDETKVHSLAVTPNSTITGTANTSISDSEGLDLIHSFVHILDVMPTLLDYAGVQHPGSFYNGREIYVPNIGKSIKPLLKGNVTDIDDNRYVSQELFGNSAVFLGDWKAIRHSLPIGNGEWQLHNLLTDPAERDNLAQEYPEILQRMVSAYDEYSKEVGVVPTDGSLSWELFGSMPDIYGYGGRNQYDRAG